MNEDNLEHYGVKGMKWGTRSNMTKSSKNTKKVNLKKKYSDISTKKNIHKGKQVLKKTIEKSNIDHLRDIENTYPLFAGMFNFD